MGYGKKGKPIVIQDPNLSEIKTQMAKTSQELEQNEIQDEIYKVTNVEPLRIPTFDGKNESIHPSVVFIEGGWGNGNRQYWMAHTPFPTNSPNVYLDRWECPSILYSSNGVDWAKPIGAPDPLVDLTTEEITRGDYYSDPCIVMNGLVMEVWYRKTNGANTNQTDIYRITSTDGITWTAPEMVLDSTRTDNGFGDMQSMRSQQVVFDGTKYTAYFSWMGGGNGIAKSETTNPSSGVWSSPILLNYINPPTGLDIWHLGMYKDEEGTLHLTGYDRVNESVEYFTSPDGLNFTYEGNILQTEGTSYQVNFTTLYQSVALKARGKWLLYASGTFRKAGSGVRRDIMLYTGDNLKKLVPFQSGSINRRLTFNESPILNNSQGVEAGEPLMYSTYYDASYNRLTGYSMKFGTTALNNAPVWVSDTKKSPIMHFYDNTTNAGGIPPHVGMVWRNTTNNRLWLSVGTSSSSDWKEVLLVGDMVKNPQRTDITIDTSISVTNVYRAVLKAGVGSQINNMTGIVDGQELVLFNTTGTNLTLKHVAGGVGQMRLRDKADKVIAHDATISFIALGTTWYEK